MADMTPPNDTRTDPAYDANRADRRDDKNYTGWIIGIVLVVLFVGLIWWWAAAWDDTPEADLAGPVIDDPAYVEDNVVTPGGDVEVIE